jgi:hypothetical protein
MVTDSVSAMVGERGTSLPSGPVHKLTDLVTCARPSSQWAHCSTAQVRGALI